MMAVPQGEPITRLADGDSGDWAARIDLNRTFVETANLKDGTGLSNRRGGRFAGTP